MNTRETAIAGRDLDTLSEHFSGLAAKIATGEYVISASLAGSTESKKNDSFLSYAPVSVHRDDGTLDVTIRPSESNKGSTIEAMSFCFQHYLFWATYPNGSLSPKEGTLTTDFRIAASGGEVYTCHDRKEKWTPGAGNVWLNEIRELGLKKLKDDQDAAWTARWEAERPERERRAQAARQEREAHVNQLKGSLKL
jgi:hypothetical protein